LKTASEATPINPSISDLNRPFWDGCREGRLMMQCCEKCGFKRYPASPICPRCLAVESSWQPVDGRGKVFSFVVFHRAYHPAWEKKVPYNVAMIELDEGPMLLSNVVGISNDALEIGLPVAVDFEAVGECTVIPVFRPAK
jgi:uncharacterized OB-fold protein